MGVVLPDEELDDARLLLDSDELLDGEELEFELLLEELELELLDSEELELLLEELELELLDKELLLGLEDELEELKLRLLLEDEELDDELLPPAQALSAKVGCGACPSDASSQPVSGGVLDVQS